MSGSKPSSPTGAKTTRAPRAPKTETTEKTPRSATARTAKTAAAAPAKTPRARAPKAAALPATPSAKPSAAQPRRQQRTGKVVSDKMQKTIVVAIETLKRHPLYKRTYKSTNRFKAHDEHNDARVGDLVRIEETRPLSKDKRWRLVEILNRAAQAPSVESVVAELAPEVEG
jgi:small subunit ribosomal protein S17